MAANLIISYDGTANDRDALALGRRFAEAGATVALAYVVHALPSDPTAELADEHFARDLLERGAAELGQRDARRHVVVNASTSVGLRELAEREHADVVVFGSDYRTAPGSVRPGTSAQRLLDGGPAAVAIAPAGLHAHGAHRIERIGVLAEHGDHAADETATSLARALDAELAAPGTGSVDLLVVGSRTEASPRRVTLSATAEYAIETSSCAVLAVPREAALSFDTVTYANA